MKFVANIATILMFAGCSTESAPAPEIISSKITVTTSGKEIENYSEEYVHRAIVTKIFLEKLATQSASTRVIRDNLGKEVGLEVLNDLDPLYLKKGDILTALGPKRLIEGGDLSIIAKQGSECSLTFLRLGRPHKTLISVK